MLHHGLAGAEGAGHGRRAALGNGEHGVDNPLAGAQGPLRGVLLLIGTADTDGPLLDHGQRHVFPVLGGQGGNGLRHIKGTALDVLDGALQVGGHHDFVEHNGSLGHGADDVAAGDLVAGLGGGGEVPLLLPIHGGNLHAAGDVGAHLLHDLLQRTLDTVVDALNHAGSKLHAHRSAGGDHVGSGAQAGGLLIDLDGGGVALHGQDLADQTLGSHADHVGHIGVRKSRGDNQRSGNFNNFSAQILKPSFRINSPEGFPPRQATPGKGPRGNVVFPLFTPPKAERSIQIICTAACTRRKCPYPSRPGRRLRSPMSPEKGRSPPERPGRTQSPFGGLTKYRHPPRAQWRAGCCFCQCPVSPPGRESG